MVHQQQLGLYILSACWLFPNQWLNPAKKNQIIPFPALMFKMAKPGNYHGHTVLVTKIYGILVADRTSGMYNCRNTCVVRYFNTIGERKKCIGSHNCAIQR